MNITLENLIFEGTHGYTEKEKARPQRFCVTITIEGDIHSAGYSDDLNDTIDYREIKTIVKDTITGEHHELLETLAETIAERIMHNERIDRVHVTVSKPDIWQTGVPSVSVTKERYIPRCHLADFDAVELIKDLYLMGATTFPLIPVARRHALIAEAKTYSFHDPTTPDSTLVRHEYQNFFPFPDESHFKDLANDFYRTLIQKIPRCELARLFCPSLVFNEFRLQRYEKNSIGITPHKDGKSKLNMICIFVLKGGGVFGLCDDRSGSNPQIIDAQPGHVIIMRAPGFMGSSYQPFHFVKDIYEERLIFGVRQHITQ